MKTIRIEVGVNYAEEENGYLKMEPEEVIKKANEFVSTYK